MGPDFDSAEPGTTAGEFGENLFGSVPELPSPRQRWTTRRKACVVDAIRGGWVPVEEACRLYSLSPDEILAWERDMDRHGIPGLRSTRLQIYRETIERNPARSMTPTARLRDLRENRWRSHGSQSRCCYTERFSRP